MIFTKTQVYNTCYEIAPKYGFEPELIFAVCLQEGGKNSSGEFAPDMARLEQNFYRRYVEKNYELSTTSEILLSASYGVMQMMGLSLKELGYFEWYFKQWSEGFRGVLGSPFSQFAIPSALDAYCVKLDWMIEWGCKWMDTKRKKAKGDLTKMLGYWNGDTSGKYAAEVFKKYNEVEKLKGRA